MDENRTDLKAALRELAAEEAEDIGPHAGLKRLIAYRRGTLPAEEREALQDHLSLCKSCAERLLELRDFEAASAGGEAAGPESLPEEAWSSLSRHLPTKESKIRPITSGRRQAPRPQDSRVLYGIAAVLLLAVIGLSVWASLTVRQERRQRARLEHQLEERERALAIAQRSLADAERQLTAARGQLQEPGRVAELEARIAELTSTVEELRRAQKTPDGHNRLAAAPEIDFSVAPRFALRGQEPASGTLQGGGAVNPVRTAQGGRITVALSLADRPLYPEYRFELIDRNGQVLWSGRRPGRILLGDAGTNASMNGLAPGRYRLRVEGLQPDRTDLLGEYLLAVER